jgi:hypothetical protein
MFVDRLIKKVCQKAGFIQLVDTFANLTLIRLQTLTNT